MEPCAPPPAFASFSCNTRQITLKFLPHNWSFGASSDAKYSGLKTMWYALRPAGPQNSKRSEFSPASDQVWLGKSPMSNVKMISKTWSVFQVPVRTAQRTLKLSYKIRKPQILLPIGVTVLPSASSDQLYSFSFIRNLADFKKKLLSVLLKAATERSDHRFSELDHSLDSTSKRPRARCMISCY
jgi:hypothetical protein